MTTVFLPTRNCWSIVADLVGRTGSDEIFRFRVSLKWLTRASRSSKGVDRRTRRLAEELQSEVDAGDPDPARSADEVDLDAMRASVEKYQDINVALAEGYITPDNHCVSAEGRGVPYHVR